MKILGLDLGTNSIGWGVVNNLGNGKFELVDRGVHIFPEGVKNEKGSEKSKAAERTQYRATRRLKFRRKLRKIETLKVLTNAKLCPPIDEEELDRWQSEKIYPANGNFREWCNSFDPKEGHEDEEYRNPYYYRWLAATRKMDLDDISDRYRLARVSH